MMAVQQSPSMTGTGGGSQQLVSTYNSIASLIDEFNSTAALIRPSSLVVRSYGVNLWHASASGDVTKNLNLINYN